MEAAGAAAAIKAERARRLEELGSDAAAAFVMGWIAEGLPLSPSSKRPGL